MILGALVAPLAAILALPSPDAFPPCATDLTCVRIHLHVAASNPGDDPSAFIATQLAGANLLFAPAGLTFELSAIQALEDTEAIIRTRAERDALGHVRFARGAVTAFFANELWDVDAPAAAPRQIRGVHWRDRADRQRRWVVVSRISPPHVLGHELGHFFGLPHSTDPASVMNKTPRTSPPPEERGFTAREQAVIRASAKRFLKDGTLVPVDASSRP